MHFRILRVNQKSIKWTWTEPFEMNTKVELVLNFVVNECCDAKEA